MIKSAGILLFRQQKEKLEVLLVHPGGPFWKNKDDGAWSIPKGEMAEDEDGLAAARREFKEETGFECDGHFIALAPVKLKSGKTVFAWALKKNIDAQKITSNDFEMEWPPRSGKKQRFPEIDRAQWFSPEDAKKKINPAQSAFIDDLMSKLADR